MWPSQKTSKDKFRFYWVCKSEPNTKHIIEWSFYSNQVSSIERQISLAFSIIAHDQFSLLETLIASLFRPHNSYCIFVDAKATTQFHNMVQQLVDCYKYQYPQARLFFISNLKITITIICLYLCSYTFFWSVSCLPDPTTNFETTNPNLTKKWPSKMGYKIYKQRVVMAHVW